MIRTVHLFGCIALVVVGCNDPAGTDDDSGASRPQGCPVILPAAIAFDPDGAASRFRVLADPAGSDLGTFDPAIVTASDGSLVLAYTSIDLQRNKLHTRIAVSQDDGETFSFAALANAAFEDVTIDALGDPDCPGGTCTNATIVHEVSTIVEDIDDPDAAARWKIFTHSYVILEPDPVAPNTPRLRYQFGHLRIGTAPAPAGPWSDPVPMIGWPSSSSMSSDAPQLVTDIEGLQDCVALTEPSAAIDEASGALELAVGCVFPSQAEFAIRVELLRSSDHGSTWSHAHVLLDASDAPCVGGVGLELNAAHLFARDGKSYLLASPAGPLSFPDGATGSGYRGCLLFARTADGIERDAAGAPIVLRRIDPGEGIFAGACSHYPNGGYVVSALSFASPPDMFRMFVP